MHVEFSKNVLKRDGGELEGWWRRDTVRKSPVRNVDLQFPDFTRPYISNDLALVIVRSLRGLLHIIYFLRRVTAARCISSMKIAWRRRRKRTEEEREREREREREKEGWHAKKKGHATLAAKKPII